MPEKRWPNEVLLIEEKQWVFEERNILTLVGFVSIRKILVVLVIFSA